MKNPIVSLLLFFLLALLVVRIVRRLTVVLKVKNT